MQAEKDQRSNLFFFFSKAYEDATSSGIFKKGKEVSEEVSGLQWVIPKKSVTAYKYRGWGFTVLVGE